MSVDPAALLAELIAIDSTSGREGEFAAELARRLEAQGWEVRLDEAAPGRPNVWAGPQDAPLLFNSHIDTVPPWFGPGREGSRITGRGACDAKGPLVAQWLAANALRERHPDQVGLLWVVGEEVDGLGARHANQHVRAKWVVVGEPTRCKLVSAHKGVVKFRLFARGVAGHSAYPERGDSAIHHLLAALARLRAADWGSDAQLGPANLNVGTLGGGRAANVIADEAWADVMLRSVWPVERAHRQVTGLVGEDATVQWTSLKEPSRMHVPDGWEAEAVSFSTDIPWMPDVGTPLLYGPGDILDAHTANEGLEEAQLHQAIVDFERLGAQLLGG